MSEKESQNRTERVNISDHAPLRYLQRIKPTEPYPRERLEAMYRRARRKPDPDVDGAAYYDPETGAVLVVDELADMVITVLRGVPE